MKIQFPKFLETITTSSTMISLIPMLKRRSQRWHSLFHEAMFLFSADSGARPVPLNSCSDVLLHLRKRGRHGHLELKCWINPTESFQIAQVLFCTVNFCSFRLAVLRLHGLRLCTQAVHSRLQAPRSGRGALRRGPERGLFAKFWGKNRKKFSDF